MGLFVVCWLRYRKKESDSRSCGPSSPIPPSYRARNEWAIDHYQCERSEPCYLYSSPLSEEVRLSIPSGSPALLLPIALMV